MATYVSKPADYGNYTQPINLDLVNFVMQSKQQKYDYNLAKLESKITDELGAIDLARAEDKKYFLDRANQILGSAGDISQIDFSNNNNARALDNRINTIVDDRVLNDVVSTANYRTFQRTLQQKQKDGDGTYNAYNAAYAMEKGGANSWLSGEKDSLGTIMYDDYYDYQEEIEDMEENLDRYVDVQKVTTTEGYYYIDKTNERLTESKIKDIVRAKMSGKTKRQMQIDAWAASGGPNADLNEVAGRYKNFSEGRLKEVDRVIAEKKLQLKAYGELKNDNTKALEQEIKEYQDFKGKLSNKYSKLMNPEEGKESYAIDNMSYEMFEENLVGGIAKRNAINRTTDIDRTLNKPMYNFDLEAHKAKLKAQGAGGTGGTPFSIRADELKGGDIFASLEEDIYKSSEASKTLINATYSGLSAEMRKLIDDSYNAESGMTKEDHILNMLNEQGTNLDKDSLTALVEINREKRLEEAYRRDRSEALEYAFEQGEGGAFIPGGGGIKKFVNEVYDNPNIDIIGEDGKLISAKQWFINNGINPDNAEEVFLNNEALKNQFFKSYYADKIVTMEGGDPAKLNQELEGLKAQKEAIVNESGWTTALDRIGRVTGAQPRLEGAELDERIAEVEAELRLSNNDVSIYRTRLEQLTGSKAEAEKIITKAREEGLYDTAAFWDNSFTDDNTLNVLSDKDNIEAKAKEFLAIEYKEGRKLGVQYNTESPEGLALLNDISNPLKAETYGPLTIIKANKATSISIVPDGEYTIITALDSSKSGDTNNKENKVVTARVLTRELPQIIRDQVNLEVDKKYNPFQPKKMDSFSGVAKYGDSTNLQQIKNVASVITKNDPQQAYFVTKDESLNALALQYTDFMGSDLNPTPLRMGIDKAMTDGNLEFRVKKIDGEFYNQVGFHNNGNFEPLYTDSIMNPIPVQDLESQYNIATYAPQIGVYYMLQNILYGYANNPTNPGSGVKKLIQYGAGQ